MTAYHNDVAGFQIVKTGNLRVLAHTSPTGGCQVTLFHSHLVQTPVHESGAVKRIGPLSAVHIRFADLGAGDGDQGTCTAAYTGTAS